jgi:hypothetical protein
VASTRSLAAPGQEEHLRRSLWPHSGEERRHEDGEQGGGKQDQGQKDFGD